MVVGAINCGGTAVYVNPFEYLPPNENRKDWSEHDLELLRIMASVPFETLLIDMGNAVCQALRDMCLCRVDSLLSQQCHNTASRTASVFSCISNGVMCLDLDKISSIARINPFVRANHYINDRETLFTSIFNFTGDSQQLLQSVHAVSVTTYTDEWLANLNTVHTNSHDIICDLVLFDVLCMRTACLGQTSYVELSRWSPYCTGEWIASPQDIIAMGSKTLSTTWHELNQLNQKASVTYDGVQSGVFIVAETPGKEALGTMFRRNAFIVENTTDAECPISIVGIGNAGMIMGITNILQVAIQPIALHPSHYQRTVGVIVSVGGKKVACVGVHWHNTDETFTALLIELVMSTILSLPEVEHGVISGDFNFQSVEEATRAVALSRTFNTVASVVDENQRAVITKVATRSSRQSQAHKTHIQQAAPRIMTFSRSAGSVQLGLLSSLVINGGVPETPNLQWPFDHGGIASTFVFSQ